LVISGKAKRVFPETPSRSNQVNLQTSSMKVNLAFNPETSISHPLTEPDNFSFYQTIYICFLRSLNTPNSARVEALFSFESSPGSLSWIGALLEIDEAQWGIT